MKFVRSNGAAEDMPRWKLTVVKSYVAPQTSRKTVGFTRLD